LLLRVQDAVSADLLGAVGAAAVPGVDVAVVADLTGVEDAVAAFLQQAGRTAAVCRVVVAVVALFLGVENRVSADLLGTVGPATVSDLLIAVVAGLAGIEDAVAAPLERALRAAAVTVVRVGVVALFLRVVNPVPAQLGRTIVAAAVAVLEVAVVALLGKLEDVVAAGRDDGVGQREERTARCELPLASLPPHTIRSHSVGRPGRHLVLEPGLRAPCNGSIRRNPEWGLDPWRRLSAVQIMEKQCLFGALRPIPSSYRRTVTDRLHESGLAIAATTGDS